MRNIDENNSLSAIRIRNKTRKLNDTDVENQIQILEIEDLKEKRNLDCEIIESASEEIKQLQKQNNDLENKNNDLENKVAVLKDALEKKSTPVGEKTVCFDYQEKQLYDDETKRIILQTIRKVVAEYEEEERKRRDYHILSDIINNNTESNMGEIFKKEIAEAIKRDRCDARMLKTLGFEQQTGSHDKYVLNGDDRYILTISNSPSDYRSGENLVHEAINLLFGRTK